MSVNTLHVGMILSNPFRPDPRVLKEARSLVNAGYSVTIICWDRRDELPKEAEIDGIRIHRIPLKSTYSAGSKQSLVLPRFWLRALKILTELKPDIVHCHDLDTAPVGFVYKIRSRTPWIFDAHESYADSIRAQINIILFFFLLALEWIMIRSADHVITVGNLLADRFRRLGGNVSLVGNYQLIEEFQPQSQIDRAKFGISDSSLIVAYIGGFTLNRAIIPLIKASSLMDDVSILIGGTGPQRQQIEATIEDYPQAQYLGWVDPDCLPEHLNLADVIYYGLNSQDRNSYYSSPNTLFNAMVLGKPVITTNIGEIAEIIRQEECGLIVSEPNPLEISQAIGKMKVKDFRSRLGENSFRAARDKYNWGIAETNLLNVYNQLLPG